MQDALLLIDIQNDYFPGGRMELVDPLSAATRAGRLLNRFRKAGLPVIHVQHISVQPGATFFLDDTFGAKIHEAVAPKDGETVVVKHRPNSFCQTDLLDILRSRNAASLAVAGMMTHMCIDSSVRAASELGFDVTLFADACATRDLIYDGDRVPARDVQAGFLAALQWMFATVMRTDDLE